MAAPSGIVWGSTVGGYGRIGIYTSASTTNTQVTLTTQIWFWSKYSVDDVSNTLYYTLSTSSSSATDSKGSVSIKTTHNSGSGWSTTNQVKLYEYTHAAYTRGTSAAKKYLYAKLANVDVVGGTMYASTTYTVPALTSYTVSYNANGGTGAPGSQTKYYGQTLKLSSTKPTRTGYSFQGWATSASGSVSYAAGANYTSNAGATLYAVWKANTYTVKFDANGGTGAPSNQTKTYGTTLTLSSTKPTRTNYNFLGWSESASATSATYSAGGSYTKNAATTLYAVWELAYTKPRITNLKITRRTSAGVLADDGTYALVQFDFACDKTATSTVVEWESEAGTTGGYNFNKTGTSGSVSTLVGGGGLSADSTWTFTVTVADSGGSTSKTQTINGTAYTIDFLSGGKGVAFGKPAETEGMADFKFQTHMRANTTYDNEVAIFGRNASGSTYSALIPVTSSGNTSLGYGLYKAGTGNTHLYGNAVQFYTNNGIFTNGSGITMDNNEVIYGLNPGGVAVEAFQAQNSSGHTVLGYGPYTRKTGNSHIYGYDISFGVSNIASPGTYRPYRRRGDTLTIKLLTAGYITSSGTTLCFFIPMAVPIVGSPTVTISSTTGFTVRQGSKYLYGSSASASVNPSSYTVERYMFNGLVVSAVFSNATNVTNNETAGIQWNGTITFS